MAVSIHQLVAAISPDIYCHRSVRRQVRQTVRDSLQAQDSMAYLKAAEIALPVEPNSGSSDAITLDDPFSLEGLNHPVARRTFVRDAMAESLEALYFRLLDLFGGDDQWQVIKLIDDFEPSPSSAAHPYFAQRILESREQSEKLIASSRTLLRSILRDLDKLKAQENRLSYYRDLESDDAERREIALVFLKQHWLETAEKQRGGMSLLRLNTQFADRQLLARFMNHAAPESAGSDAAKDWLDRTLAERREAFTRWLATSESEMAKQVALQQTQLRQDLNRLKLHARWLKPLLDQGKASSPVGDSRASLVTAFNTLAFQLVLLAQGTSTLDEQVQRGALPQALIRPKIRRYQPVLVLEMEFRATRNRSPGIRGRVETRLTSYGLREDELTILRREVERQELGETIMGIDATANDMVTQLMGLVDSSPTLPQTGLAGAKQTDANPFYALFSLFVGLWRWLRGTSPRSTSRDSHLEQVARTIAITDARGACELAFEALKQRR